MINITLIIVKKIKNSALPNSVIVIKNIFNPTFLCNTKKLYIVEQKGSTGFPDRIRDIENQAKGTTEILVGEEREL